MYCLKQECNILNHLFKPKIFKYISMCVYVLCYNNYFNILVFCMIIILHYIKYYKT